MRNTSKGYFVDESRTERFERAQERNAKRERHNARNAQRSLKRSQGEK
jgi:hypothetical protein